VFCDEAAKTSGFSSFNLRVCNSVPGTMDSGRVGRGVVVEYFKKFALYGISLATPV
jgi:hypothetical protein